MGETAIFVANHFLQRVIAAQNSGNTYPGDSINNHAFLHLDGFYRSTVCGISMLGLYSTKDLLKLLCLVALYVLLAKIVELLFTSNTVIGYLWLASGVALVAVLLGGYHFMLAVFLGALLGQWLTGNSLIVSLTIALCHAATVFLGVWLLKRDSSFDPYFGKLEDYLRILVLALGFGLIVAVSMHVATWLTPSFADGQNFTQRWAGNTLCIVLIMPLLLVWRRIPRAWTAPRAVGEAVLILGLSFIVGQIVFLNLFQDSLGPIARGYWMFPIVAWSAVRLGPHGTVLILLVSAIQGAVGARLGIGFFSNDIAQTQLANHFFFNLSLSMVAMALATYVAGRKHDEEEILKTKNQLQATLDAIPDLLFELGLDGRYYAYHSPRKELLVVPLSALLGKTLAEVLPPAAAEVCLSALREASETGGSLGKTFALQLPQGEHWFELSVAPRPGAIGEEPHFIVLSRDITERKKVEQKLSESETQLHELANFLQRVREEDRARFARELHDELGQDLTALRIDFDRLANEMATASPHINERLSAIDKTIDATVDATRRICEELRPAMLDDLGLEAALASYARRFTKQFGVSCDLSLDRENFGMDEQLSTAIFRIVQESLTNIARHARASHAMIALEVRGDDLMLTIADDGCGLSAAVPGERRTAHGLLGMRERVKMLAGSIEIDSSPEHGTHIEVCIPRNGRRAA